MIGTTHSIPAQPVRLKTILPMSKKFVQLPVTAFTHRILTARYGQPIRASRMYNKELFILLQLAPIQPLNEKRAALLTHQAHFAVPPALSAALHQRDLPAIGMALHEHYIREMYLHTHSQVFAGRTAWTALEDFYAMHGITEEDWKFDTAYRKWLTYSTQVEKRGGNEKTVNLRPSQNIRSTVYLLIADLDGWTINAGHIADAIAQCEIPYQDSRLIQAFLFKQLLRLDTSTVARRMDYTRQNAYCRLESMANKLNGETITGRRLVRVLSKIKQAAQRPYSLFD